MGRQRQRRTSPSDRDALTGTAAGTSSEPGSEPGDVTGTEPRSTAANDAVRPDRTALPMSDEFDPSTSRSWVEALADIVRMTHGGTAAAPRAALACDIGPRDHTLFLPPEMRSLQPRGLRWLEALAGSAGLRLSVDKRQNRSSPLIEQRNGQPPLIASGIAGLLQQTGLPGTPARLSLPHRLLADSPLIDLPRLIAMCAHAAPHAKQVVVLPNAQLVDVLHDDTRPIKGFACVLDTRIGPTVLSHFDSPSLRCIGYATGRQYVVHVLLAGGTLHAPSLWTTPQTLARTEPRFRLFHGHRADNDFGLVYTTLYYDMQRHRPKPWWMAERDAVAQPVSPF